MPTNQLSILQLNRNDLFPRFKDIDRKSLLKNHFNFCFELAIPYDLVLFIDNDTQIYIVKSRYNINKTERM